MFVMLMRMRAHDADNAVLLRTRTRPKFYFSFPLGSLKAGSYLASTNPMLRECTWIATRMHRDCHGNTPGLPRECTGIATGTHRDCHGNAAKLQQGSATSYERDTTVSWNAPAWWGLSVLRSS